MAEARLIMRRQGVLFSSSVFRRSAANVVSDDRRCKSLNSLFVTVGSISLKHTSESLELIPVSQRPSNPNFGSYPSHPKAFSYRDFQVD